MSYKLAHNFGSLSNLPTYNNDPLTYCIGTSATQLFNHPTSVLSVGQNSTPCQIYMATRCAQNWDGVCEYMSTNQNGEYDTVAQISSQSNGIYLTPGDILLVNTAQRKYLIEMLGANCKLHTEPFDPISTGGSPYISKFIGNCYPMYVVDPKTINFDPVMNKLLNKPWIAKDFFIKLKNSMVHYGIFLNLKGTRLGNFYGL